MGNLGELVTSKVLIADLQPFHKNPRIGNVEEIAKSLQVNGQYKPIVVNKGSHTGRQLEVLAGNHTMKAAATLGWNTIQAVVIDVNDEQATRIALADNRTADLGEYDDDLIAELLQSLPDLDGTGFDDEDLERMLSEPPEDVASPSLAERFGAPPLTVLNARARDWQARKKEWIAAGIRSEIGRDEALVYDSPQTRFTNWYQVKNSLERDAGRPLSNDEVIAAAGDKLDDSGGTSVFDPALTELLISWFSASDARVIDPWAGGSVRGIVAATLGRAYTGIELRPEQVEADRAQMPIVRAVVEAMLGEGEGVVGGSADVDALPGTRTDPIWLLGDSREVLPTLEPGSFDFAIGCPPYYSLEHYSDDPRDLSNMTVPEFDAAMADTISKVERVLADDSFAVFVVGNVRDPKGYILDMRRCMLNAAEAAGMRLVNDAVLVTPIGSAAIRAARAFTTARTLARVHQEVLVFVKGDRRRAAARCGDIDMNALAPVFEDVTDE